jgi:hypothetical protein
MVQMKDINEIIPSEYGSFYLTTFTEDFNLYQYTANGLLEYTDFDKYTTDSGILIAFKSRKDGPTDFNYIAKNETKEELVDFQCYENIFEHIEATGYINNGTFAFFDSVHFPNLSELDKNKIGMDMDRRCDKDATGPRGFINSTDGVHNYAFDKEKVNDRNVTYFTTILSVLGDCHLVMFGGKSDLGFADYPMVTSWSSSLFGCLKLIQEWESVSRNPFFNNEPQAIKAKTFIEKTQMPQDVLDEIKDNQIDMSVYSYIRNPNNCRIVNQENVVLPEKTKSWIKSKLRYKSLSSLLIHNPNKFSINESILAEEKRLLKDCLYAISLSSGLEDFDQIVLENSVDISGLVGNDLANINIIEVIRKSICIK